MAKKLDLNKPVFELVQEYPELVDVLKDLGFSEITKPAMLNSVGRITTIPKGAKMRNISMMKVVPALMSNGFELIGKMPNIFALGKNNAGDETSSEDGAFQENTREKIKSYLKRLGEGEDLESVRKDFVENFSEVEASEIMKAEQELIKEGTPITEVQNLCDVHSALFHGATKEEKIANAEKAVEEGATITLSNTPVAVRMGEVSALAEKLNCEVIAADATSVEDLENVFKRSMEVLGGQVDFVLHSIGMSPNVRKKRTYDNLDYDMLDKTLDISAVSFHKMIQAAKKMNAIAEYGSILALSYVAAQRTFYGYNDMADAKALLESIARSFGYIYGREHNVRVNTISQSPTMTTAGSGVKGMDKLFDFANRMSPLGNASADECADYCIVMFSDLTRKVTMQNLFHDGGFSSVGMSLRAMATYEKGLDEYKDENGNIIYG